VGYVSCTGRRKSYANIWSEKLKGDIGVGGKSVGWIELAQNRVKWPIFIKTVIKLRVI
jgi:hypothetical protein